MVVNGVVLGPLDEVAQPLRRPDVGVLEVTGEGQARLTLPLPYRESILNVLTLTR